MIAFDKLLKNLDDYKRMYAQMGCDYDLDVFVQLEAERKATQLECEAARAECNKLCAKMPQLRDAGADTSELMSQILSLDEKANQLKQQLDAQSNDIDDRLKHLRNIPAPFVAKDEPLEVNSTLATTDGATVNPVVDLTAGNPTTFDGKFSVNELKQFFKSKYSCFECNFSINNDLKSKKNRLFLEEELPAVDFCADGISVLCTDYEARAELEKIKLVLLSRALSAYRVSSLKLDFSASEAFKFKFSNGEVQLQFVGDFCARDFSIKYKNKAQDSTKFVSQIILKPKFKSL